MSQVKPVYAEVTEFSKIAKDVLKNTTELFPSTDEDEFVDNIKVVAITNKQRKEGKELVSIRGVPQPVRMFCSCAYVVEMYLDDWSEMSDTQREWVVLSILKRIPTDSDKEGKVLPLDYKDDGLIVRTVGPDWQNSDDLPSLTKVNPTNPIEWGGFGHESTGFLEIDVTTDDDSDDEESEESEESDDNDADEVPEGFEEVK